MTVTVTAQLGRLHLVFTVDEAGTEWADDIVRDALASELAGEQVQLTPTGPWAAVRVDDGLAMTRWLEQLGAEVATDEGEWPEDERVAVPPEAPA